MNIFILFFQAGSGIFGMLLPLALIAGIFYFLVIMPQRLQQKELQELIASLKSVDEVVTSGGIIGKVLEVRETSFVIRSADKSNMEIGKSAVVGKRADEVKK